jgi:hypothetical protein
MRSLSVDQLQHQTLGALSEYSLHLEDLVKVGKVFKLCGRLRSQVSVDGWRLFELGEAAILDRFDNVTVVGSLSQAVEEPRVA